MQISCRRAENKRKKRKTKNNRESYETRRRREFIVLIMVNKADRGTAITAGDRYPVYVPKYVPYTIFFALYLLLLLRRLPLVAEARAEGKLDFYTIFINYRHTLCDMYKLEMTRNRIYTAR